MMKRQSNSWSTSDPPRTIHILLRQTVVERGGRYFGLTWFSARGRAQATTKASSLVCRPLSAVSRKDESATAVITKKRGFSRAAGSVGDLIDSPILYGLEANLEIRAGPAA